MRKQTRVKTDTSRMKVADAKHQRLRFIENVIGWEGCLSRQRILEAFGISANHVTNDIREYKEMCPGNVMYDESTRTYRPTPGFTPMISSGRAEECLSALRASTECGGEAFTVLPGGRISCATLPAVRPVLDSKILGSVTRSIVSGKGLRIIYQSMTSPLGKVRMVWPHALVFTGIRWHARCYEDSRNDFMDISLSRILSATEGGESCPIASDKDRGWKETVNLKIVPNPKQTDAHVAVVAQEYGMTRKKGRWEWAFSARKCLVPYIVDLYRLADKEASQAHPVVLENFKEIEKWLTTNDD